jgi:hypothetical protein
MKTKAERRASEQKGERERERGGRERERERESNDFLFVFLFSTYFQLLGIKSLHPYLHRRLGMQN